ncbi:MAG TPA: NUDIX hydrolase [Thermoanaerobaculia bacterium]|nr:NUDIX hydrolase [Thermoanaerobaculia bacterium]
MNNSLPEPHAALREELVTYRAADVAEERHRLDILQLLDVGSASLTRAHFAPGHITASAFIVHPATRRLLLHHHRRLNKWLQMGGHVEPGETAAQAALREGSEESGLRSLRFLQNNVLDLDIHPIPAGKGEPDHHHFDVRYLLATEDVDSIRPDPAESIDLRWFGLDEAANLMGEAGSLRVTEKIRRILKN